jgi:uncharacterized protein (TIGR02453 family)
MAAGGAFRGFPAQGINFLRQLKKNNDRDWFNARKPVFEEQVRQPMLELIRSVHADMLAYAPEYVGDPAKCIFRIYRDTRFSKDKTPYKTHIAAYLWRNGLGKDSGAGFYFYASPTEAGVAGGLYDPVPDQLLIVRHRIAADPDGFRHLFENRRMRKLFGELGGAALTRPPKGFDPDHPAIDLLKHKSFVLHAKFDPAIASTPRFYKEIVTRIEAATPFVEYLNEPLIERTKTKRREEAFLR